MAQFLLTGDVGGTNARLGLAAMTETGPALLYSEHFLCRDFTSFRDVIHEFLAGLVRVSPDLRPQAAAIAAAGPVNSEGADLPNGPWNVRFTDFAGLGLGPIDLLNDFEALALGIVHLGRSNLRPIGANPPGEPDAPQMVVGAGTGFGLAGIVPTGHGSPRILATEGGHASFAPDDEFEIEVLRILARQFGRVSVERLISGPGLVSLYHACAEIEGRPGEAEIEPEEIASRALKLREPLAHTTLSRFCSIWGSIAGDAALTFGARGGVYVAGAMANGMADFLAQSEFRERFERKGRLTPYLRAIPTLLVTNAQAPLLGAATRAAARLVRC